MYRDVGYDPVVYMLPWPHIRSYVGYDPVVVTVVFTRLISLYVASSTLFKSSPDMSINVQKMAPMKGHRVETLIYAHKWRTQTGRSLWHQYDDNDHIWRVMTSDVVWHQLIYANLCRRTDRQTIFSRCTLTCDLRSQVRKLWSLGSKCIPYLQFVWECPNWWASQLDWWIEGFLWLLIMFLRHSLNYVHYWYEFTLRFVIVNAFFWL